MVQYQHIRPDFGQGSTIIYDAYVQLIEGVSHFVYSTWRISCGQPVSLLELETQAEVDRCTAPLRDPGQVHAALVIAMLGRNTDDKWPGGVFHTHHVSDLRRASLRSQ